MVWTTRPSAALDALLLPFEDGLIASADGTETLFLGARWHPRLGSAANGQPVVRQHLKNHAQELEKQGYPFSHLPQDKQFLRVLVLCSRQRDEARAQLASAVQSTVPHGVVAAAAANNQGAKSLEADLARLAGPVRSLSKHKCRVFRCEVNPARVDHALVDEWLAFDRVQINDSDLFSRPGLFSWRHADPASCLLAAHLPPSLRGRIADLGAGYGYLSCEIVQRCSGVTALDLFEADQRALEPARQNMQRAIRASGREVEVAVYWHDVTRSVPQKYDHVVANPPFHEGRVDRPELGHAFLGAGAAALRPGGSMWLVANRHLPYESTMRNLFARVQTLAEEGGFKVLRGEV